MKKVVFLILLIPISFLLSAQTLPDGSFENGWTEYSSAYGTYWDYQNEIFYSLNELFEEPLINVITTYRETTSPQDGNYALKLVSKSPPTFIPGAIGTISPNFIQEFLNNGGLDVRKDFPFVEQPVALMGYYKFIPVAGDSAAIDFAVYNGDIELAAAKKIEKNMISTWKEFYLPLTYETTELANKVKILFVASAGYDFDNLENCKGRENSTLYIDNIAFGYPSGLTESLTNRTKLAVYPNPSSSIVNFKSAEFYQAELSIYNEIGATVAKEKIVGTNFQLDVSHWENGNYFYRLISENRILQSGKFTVLK